MINDNKAPKMGRFPTMGTSLRAETLAVLLASSDMTGVESLFEHRKIALNTVMRALMRKYGWPIERHDFPTNTADGRAAWASVYSLPQEVIDAALDAGGRDWIEGVRAARIGRAKRPLRRP
ncbi:MAG: hypothetical protein ABWY27_03765 [Telluria sp.]